MPVDAMPIHGSLPTKVALDRIRPLLLRSGQAWEELEVAADGSGVSLGGRVRAGAANWASLAGSDEGA
jgi:hypothetical protein